MPTSKPRILMGKTRNFDGDVGRAHHHRKNREGPVNEVALGHLGYPGQIGVGWVPQNDVTMEAVRADDYFPLPPVYKYLMEPAGGTRNFRGCGGCMDFFGLPIARLHGVFRRENRGVLRSLAAFRLWN